MSAVLQRLHKKAPQISLDSSRQGRLIDCPVHVSGLSHPILMAVACQAEFPLGFSQIPSPQWHSMLSYSSLTRAFSSPLSHRLSFSVPVSFHLCFCILFYFLLSYAAVSCKHLSLFSVPTPFLFQSSRLAVDSKNYKKKVAGQQEFFLSALGRAQCDNTVCNMTENDRKHPSCSPDTSYAAL